MNAFCFSLKKKKIVVSSTETAENLQACEYTKKTNKELTKAGGGQREHTPNVKHTVPDQPVTPT